MEKVEDWFNDGIISLMNSMILSTDKNVLNLKMITISDRLFGYGVYYLMCSRQVK